MDFSQSYIQVDNEIMSFASYYTLAPSIADGKIKYPVSYLACVPYLQFSIIKSFTIYRSWTIKDRPIENFDLTSFN